MKVFIELSAEHYDSLVTKCRDSWLAECTPLIEGLVARQQTKTVRRGEVAIVCEPYQAHNLLVLAQSLGSPAVVEAIRKALAYPRAQ